MNTNRMYEEKSAVKGLMSLKAGAAYNGLHCMVIFMLSASPTNTLQDLYAWPDLSRLQKWFR